MIQPLKEHIACLFCGADDSRPWAIENGYTAVRCQSCGLIYVNPRPSIQLISEAVQTGVHSDVEHGRTAIGRRVGAKVAQYRALLGKVFQDVWNHQRAISWLDVGSGYGELIEAVAGLAAPGSNVVGLEPMKPKADAARARGLQVKEAYLSEVNQKYDFLSLINVYSHIPDFRSFLKDVKKVLSAHGEILIETGNTADLANRSEVPGELDLPDHLVFAGEKHLVGYLEEAGFRIVTIHRMRVDGFLKVMKNIVKKMLGRDVTLSMPYTSGYRSLMIRARMN